MSRTRPHVEMAADSVSVPDGTAPASDRPAHEPPVGTASIQPEIARLLTEGAPAYVADTTGRITFANDAFRELIKTLTSEDGEDATHVFPLHEVVAEVVALDRPVRREDVHQLDADVLYLTSEHRPLHDADGRVVAVGGTIHDSSREASAWLEALAARERFREIARLVSDWLWETDAEFNLTYVSARAMEILGIHPRHMIGRNLFSLGTFPPRSGGDPPPSASTRSPFRNVLFAIPTVAGDECLFELSGIPIFDDSRGAFRGYRGTARDITAQTRARNETARVQRRLEVAIENVSEGFALWNRGQHLSIHNPCFKNMFTASGGKVDEGLPFDAFLARAEAAGFFASGAADADKWREARARAVEGADGTATIRLADGRWLRISERRAGTRSVVTIVSDITEHKEREAALVVAKEMAEVASRSKGEFLANMSHELRTPLNAIIGFSEIMDRATFGPLGNDRYKGYIRDIIRSSRHLLGIINDILETAKMEAGKLDLDEEEFDLAEDVCDTVQLLAEQAAEGRVTLAVRVEPRLPRLHGDRRRIRQIVLNLVSNAIKFTPVDGRVAIELAHRPSGEITLAVVDTGIGIAAEDVPKVLAPFGQVEGSLNRRHEGTGLGLPLSKALAELHGGNLSIDSTPGHGTRVTVVFPPARTCPL